MSTGVINVGNIEEVIVVGGGIGGLAAAYGIAKLGTSYLDFSPFFFS